MSRFYCCGFDGIIFQSAQKDKEILSQFIFPPQPVTAQVVDLLKDVSVRPCLLQPPCASTITMGIQSAYNTPCLSLFQIHLFFTLPLPNLTPFVSTAFIVLLLIYWFIPTLKGLQQSFLKMFLALFASLWSSVFLL